jgi:hypothetical protein
MMNAAESNSKSESSGFGKLLYTVGGFFVGGFIGRIISNITGVIFAKSTVDSLIKGNEKPFISLVFGSFFITLGSAIVGAVKGYNYAATKEKKENESQKALEEIRQSIAQKPKEMMAATEHPNSQHYSSKIDSKTEYGSHAANVLADKERTLEAELVR